MNALTPKQLEQFLRVIEERYDGIEDHDKQPTTFLREVADISLVTCYEALSSQYVGRFYSYHHFICLELRTVMRARAAKPRTKLRCG